MPIEHQQDFSIDIDPKQVIDLLFANTRQKNVIGDYSALSAHFFLILNEVNFPTGTAPNSYEIQLYQSEEDVAGENTSSEIRRRMSLIGEVGKIEIREPSIGMSEAELFIETDPIKWITPFIQSEYYDGIRDGELWENVYLHVPMETGHRILSRYWQTVVDEWKDLKKTRDDERKAMPEKPEKDAPHVEWFEYRQQMKKLGFHITLETIAAEVTCVPGHIRNEHATWMQEFREIPDKSPDKI